MIRLFSLLLLLTLHVSSAGEITLEEAKKDGRYETLLNYIKHNSVIADICVYEQ